MTQAVGRVETEFKTLRDDVGKSVDALTSKFDSSLTIISQKIDSIEAVQGELTQKVETIATQSSDVALIVTTLEGDYGSLQEEIVRLQKHECLQRLCRQ